MVQRYYLNIEGKVQGVGFRFFTQQQAAEYDLVGWVRNNSNGSVEAEVEGDDQQIDLFLEAIKTKNRFAKVNQIHQKQIDELKSERSFKVIH
ncbi:acylphosphatase [Alkalicoccobacillus gibsonii]|uniref:acylphosphatase n=1 Tax=Alkalicoccobacillus gibsonii TaxID=79881 RepID=UPI003F7C6692